MKVVFSVVFLMSLSMTSFAQQSHSMGKFECTVSFLQRGDGVYVNLKSKPIIFDFAPSKNVTLTERDFTIVKSDDLESHGIKMIHDSKQSNLEKIKAEIGISTLVGQDSKPYGFLATGKLALIDNDEEYGLSQNFSNSGILSDGSSSSLLLHLDADQVDVSGSVFCNYKKQ